MSGVIFSMVLRRKKYFQWSTSRWVGNVNSLENAIKDRLFFKKLYILCGIYDLGKRDKTACSEWLFLSPSNVDKTSDLSRRNEVGNIMRPSLIVYNDWKDSIIHTSINNIQPYLPYMNIECSSIYAVFVCWTSSLIWGIHLKKEIKYRLLLRDDLRRHT